MIYIQLDWNKITVFTILKTFVLRDSRWRPKSVCLLMLNATFNNISGIKWWSVLIVEENGGPGETTNLSQVSDKLYHILLYTSTWSRFELTTSVVIGTDCIGSCKSNKYDWKLQIYDTARNVKNLKVYNVSYMQLD